MEQDFIMDLSSKETVHVTIVNKPVIRQVDLFTHKVQYLKDLIGY